MLKNYIKVMLRNIKKQKIYSIINIVSLVIGLSCSILILLFIRYEFSFDQFHDDASSIYRVLREFRGEKTWSNSSEHPLAASLKRDFPEVVNATRVKKNDEVGVVEFNTKHFYEEDIYFADQDFLEIFSFPLNSGERLSALKEPFSVLLTQEMAEKYFGKKDPLGQVIYIQEWYSHKKHDYKVKGVLEDIPNNSHFTFDFLISYNTLYSLKNGGKSSVETWSYYEPKTYVKLEKQADPRGLEEKLPAFLRRYKGKDSDYEKIHLQSLKDIHLGGNMKFELETNSDMRFIYIFSAIALFILIIACLNYVNLSAARSSKRAVEAGMRKVVGAHKSQLVRQFLGESLIFSFFSFLMALLVVDLILPIFNSLMERDLTLDLFNNLDLLFMFLTIALFMGLLSGSYPAFLISSFQPARIIKGTLKIGSKKSAVFRNSLVVVQFVVSVVLLFCTFVVHNQLHYIKNKNLGFDKEQIITVYTMDPNLKRNPESFMRELQRNPGIRGISASLDLPTTIRRSSGVQWIEKGIQKESEMNFTFVDYDYFDVYDIEIEQGRNFSSEFPSDQKQAVVLNRTAAKDLGWEDPVGQKLFVHGKEWIVIGVVNDFHYHSLHWKIEPLVFVFYKGRGMDYFSIKVSPNNLPKTLGVIKDNWKQFSPEFPFQFAFLDERIDRTYKAEEKLGAIFNVFSFLALSIACLGLFGLTSFLSEQKRKEISVRKILGADSKTIIFLLSKEYMNCLALAVAIAWPIGYFVMNKWLQNFVYRTSIGIENFAFSSLLALVFALFTVSYHSLKAAVTDPVDSLRYE